MFTARTGTIAVVMTVALSGPLGPGFMPGPRAADEADLLVIPMPARVERGSGVLALPARPTIGGNGDQTIGRELALAARQLSRDWALPVTVGPDPLIVLALDSAAADSPEGYRLSVTAGGVTLAAPSPAGLLYAVQTLRQLGRPNPAGDEVTLPVVEIHDAPRFGYRGMHLDVVRHFFSVEFVKRYLDWMALYKMNTFHWHLTDDQGWRIEIRGYPRLTTVAGYRKETMVEKNFDPYVGDGVRYGGFYTQDQIREVVAYAAERHITVIPEIEMPGHSLAALAAYPELACTPGPFEVGTRWGVFPDIFCPSDTTFAFLEDVLTEVMGLFPSRYIHIGGDEAPKERWRESPVAQAVIRREGLADEHELQSYFVRRIETFLNGHGRRLIGWDEILEGGLAPDATVMSWRGMDGGIAAARQGHDVIMTPGSHLYFDHYQGPRDLEPLAIGGYSPLEKVYAFEPVPPELTAGEARYVLGAQGNVWTEYILTPDAVEYMVFPRMLALAEVVWSPREARDWSDFQERLPPHLSRLGRAGVAFRVPDVLGLEHDRLSLTDTFSLTLSHVLPDAVIHYTLDGTTPDAGSPRYGGPIALRPTRAGIQVAARAVLTDGRLGPASRATIRRTSLRPPDGTASAALEAGLRFEYRLGRARNAAGVDRLSRAAVGTTMAVGLRGDEQPEEFGYVFAGYLRAPEDGIYEFRLSSDDGSRLWIGDQVVVDNDGLHSERTVVGAAALAGGAHRVRIRYVQAGGGKALRLEVRRDEGAWTDGAEWWFHDPGGSKP